MSIIRVGTSSQYASGWDLAFSKAKSSKGTVGSSTVKTKLSGKKSVKKATKKLAKRR